MFPRILFVTTGSEAHRCIHFNMCEMKYSAKDIVEANEKGNKMYILYIHTYMNKIEVGVDGVFLISPKSLKVSVVQPAGVLKAWTGFSWKTIDTLENGGWGKHKRTKSTSVVTFLSLEEHVVNVKEANSSEKPLHSFLRHFQAILTKLITYCIHLYVCMFKTKSCL